MNKPVTLKDTTIAALAGSIAALPMYDLPQLQQATDAFWQAIAERLRHAGVTDVPLSLTRSNGYRAAWRHPQLLLGQTCGYPLLTRLKNTVQIVATPIYRSPGCEGIEHCSFFIVNAKARHRMLPDLRGSICAVNGFDSNTGMNLLRAAIAPIAQRRHFFSSVLVTGAHYESLKAVANGYADITAIDCISFEHFQRFEPELTKRVVVIGESPRTAAPPFITSKNTDAQTVDILKKVLKDVAIAPELDSIRTALNIDGFAFETETAYERLLLLEKSAIAFGYPKLR
jgi:ABC-type phosphate/phosphonate transport system substrate-binding protein